MESKCKPEETQTISGNEFLHMSIAGDDRAQHGNEGPLAVLGIAASAAEGETLKQFFAKIPSGSRLSYAAILHQGEPADLTATLTTATSIPVLVATDGVPLQPDTVFIIPPDSNLILSNGYLREGPLHHHPSSRPIDRFFHSLAADMSERAFAIILSGPEKDGAEGIKAVRKAGGFVIVQDPDSALQPAMPRNAIDTGAADLILPTEHMGEKILDIARRTYSPTISLEQTTELNNQLREIFCLVKTRTGHDFSSYKTNTVMRRIDRRLSAKSVEGLDNYISVLKECPDEADALCQEFLIGVTSFFRDPEAFQLLEHSVIPSLFVDRQPDDPIRVWHPCCSTGEEAYSTAILFREYLEKHRLDVQVLIFATDIDEQSITRARSGIFPESIEAQLGRERLQKFFVKTGNQYQVIKQLREMIVFAHHNIIRDPPFSRLDLLVCRNFLIYLNTEMQLRLVSLFHQVLKPSGYLFCGSSETVDRYPNHFVPISKKWKIFARSNAGFHRQAIIPPAYPPKVPNIPRPARQVCAEEPNTVRCVEKILFDRYAPPCVVVNEKFEVVHVSTRTNRFLEIPIGEPTRDILKMAHSDLRPALRAAIHKALTEQKRISYRGVSIGTSDSTAKINVVAEPIDTMSSPDKLIMVVFEPDVPTEQPTLSPSKMVGAMPGDESEKDELIRQLEEQLRVTQEQLLTTIEQLESSNEGLVSVNEELMSTNEEFQATNEELQSTNEELETSREELQSLNEELVTVNTELQGKIEELNRANSDMENFLISADIGTIFLDRDFNIMRFTPAISTIFNIIPSDIGRPFRHLANAIDWQSFFDLAQSVLHDAAPRERELANLGNGQCHIMRMLPYRTSTGDIDGIVVTFIDISERKVAEDNLRIAKDHWERTFNSVPDLIAILDNQHRIVQVNQAMADKLGTSPHDCIGLPCYAAVHCTEEPPVFCPHSRTLEDGEEHGAEVREERLGGDYFVTTTPLANSDGVMSGTVHVARNITERKLAEQALTQSKERLRRLTDHLPCYVANIDSEERYRFVNETYRTWFGRDPDEVLDLTVKELVGPENYAHIKHHIDSALSGNIVSFDYSMRLPDNSRRYVNATYVPDMDTDGSVQGFYATVIDLTERQHAKEILRQSEERYRILAHHSPIGMFINRNDSIDWVNPAARSLFGAREPVELLGLSPFDLFHPDFHPLMKLRIAELLKGNPVGMIVEKIIRLDGTERDVEVVAVPFTDSMGSAILVMLNDITERLQTERERELTVQFLRLVNECQNRNEMVRAAVTFIQKTCGCQSVGIRLRTGKTYPYLECYGQEGTLSVRENGLCVDGDLEGSNCLCGCIIFGKPSTEYVCITDKETFSTTCVSSLFDHHPDLSRRQSADNSCNWKQYESVTMIPLYTGEERFGLLQLNDHRQSFFSPAAIALWERLAGHLAVALEKFRIEEELKEKEERWQFAIEGSNDGVWDRNVPTGEIFFSKKWKEMLGYSEDEIGSTITEWLNRVHTDDLPKVQKELDRHLAGEIPLYSVEYRMQSKDGSYKWILARGKVISWTEECKPIRFVGTHSDITDKKNLEEQLYQSQKMEAVGQLAGGIAHDFNNILTAIIGYSHLISMNTDQAPPGTSLRSYVEQIHASAERAAELTQALLAFSRKQVMVPKVLSLNETVNQLEKLLRRLISENIELEFDMHPGELNVMADKSKIEQMLINLVTNAKDAMPGNGVISIATSLTSMNEKTIAQQGFGRIGTYACISVSDTGFGIDKEIRKKIFEPFFTTKEVGKGTGLGLSIVYGIVKQHKGYIDVASSPGKGTTFCIFLPVVTEKISEPAIGAKITISGGHETILLAEDDPAVRSFHKTLFENAGYTVITAEDGKEALEAFIRHEDEIDLLVLDVVMPKINGIHLHEMICKKKPDIKSLFLSGYTADTLKEVGGSWNKERILHKPVDPGELLINIRQVLSGENS